MTDHSRILIRRGGKSWSAPEVAAYNDEAHLQSVLSTDPSRVPGVQDGALAVEELATSSGPIDVCIVSRDGSITVVECKLATNTERRRMVVGQVIDYAAAIWIDGADAFLDAWRRRGGGDLATVLEPAALGQLKRNCSEARIDLCLAVDGIDSELRRLVEYLNRVTRDDVMVTALQLAYARDADVEILIPSTFGGEIAAAKARESGRSTEPWTWGSFMAALDSDSDRQLAHQLLSRLEQLDDRRGSHEPLWFGASPSGGVFFHPYGLRYAPFQLWVNSLGELMLYGNWHNYGAVARHPGFAGLAQLLGQDHQGRSKGVRVASLDLEELWTAALNCAAAIND